MIRQRSIGPGIQGASRCAGWPVEEPRRFLGFGLFLLAVAIRIWNKLSALRCRAHPPIGWYAGHDGRANGVTPVSPAGARLRRARFMVSKTFRWHTAPVYYGLAAA